MRKLSLLVVPLAVFLVAGCEEPRMVSESQCIHHAPSASQPDEQEPLIWVSVEMRNEDRLTGVLILDKLVVGTDYGEIIIPLQGDWSITFASKDGDGDEVTFMGPTRISEHSSSGSGDANRLMGHVTPDRIRIRLVNGQELEIGRDQIRAVTYVGSRRR